MSRVARDRPSSSALPDAEGPAPPDLAASPPAHWSPGALALLRAELRWRRGQAHWIALAPGASERWGHHRAPPARQEARGVRIDPEFAQRLHTAWRLLDGGVVRFVMVSGGCVDRGRPDYNEALRARDHFLARYAASWGARGDLADRILVEPLAHTTPANLRNAAKLCAALGVDHYLIATTMPPDAGAGLGALARGHVTRHGFYILHQGRSSFALRCALTLGYRLGEFAWLDAPVRGARVPVIVHSGFPTARLTADTFGP